MFRIPLPLISPYKSFSGCIIDLLYELFFFLKEIFFCAGPLVGYAVGFVAVNHSALLLSPNENLTDDRSHFPFPALKSSFHFFLMPTVTLGLLWDVCQPNRCSFVSNLPCVLGYFSTLTLSLMFLGFKGHATVGFFLFITTGIVLPQSVGWLLIKCGKL